jgi:hypothetical protein
MDVIEPKQLRDAQEMFRELLKRESKEPEFQDFFAQHPYVLTPSLPLRLEPKDLVPLGRPGHTEPDFIFYPHDADTVDFYGVIELKRPDHRIVTITRSNTAILTRDAQSAVAQAQQYIEVVPDLIQRPLSNGHLFLGNDRYLFVIMGLTTREKIFDATHKAFLQSLQNQLRPFGNLHILPYDFLLKNFEKRIYRHIYILVPKPTVSGPIRLRREPILQFSFDKVRAVLQEKGFYDKHWNWVGEGIKHQYKPDKRRGAKLVIDHTTDLTWQRSGSLESLTYDRAEKYIRGLNDQKFAGYTDWRLPTLEEGMSLMEPKKYGKLYIDPVFDQQQDWIWTADIESAGLPCVVGFDDGYCSCLNNYVYGLYVRAVRSGQ